MMLSTLACLLIALAGPVQRWSSPIPLEGEEITFSDQGVHVRPAEEIIAVVIPWYDVRSLPEGWTAEAQPYKEIATLAKRAHERRLRGDPIAAAAAYKSLDARINPVRGEQALDIASGLLDSALATGSRSDAIAPWLRVIRLNPGSAAAHESAIDPDTGLHPEIVPVFIESTQIIAAPAELIGEREQILFAYYELASAPANDAEAEDTLNELFIRMRSLDLRDAGLQLVHDLVKCQIAIDSTARISARDALRRRLRSGLSGWTTSWIRLALGVSLLNESDPEDRELGVLECIAVVIDHDDTPQSIVRLAADIAESYLRGTSRDQYADRIRMTAYLDHESTTDSRP